MPVQYTGAVGIVSRCVADIGKKKREEEAEDYELDFNELCECTTTMYIYMQVVYFCLLLSESTQTA